MKVVVCALLGGAALVFATRSTAQEAVRVYPMGDARPGREAPAFSLPFARAEGPSPEAQPFTLRAELGRVVVLAFCPAVTDSATTSLLRSLNSNYDSLFTGDLVVAAVLPSSVTELVETARANGLPYKLLSDSGGTVRRLFGVERRTLAVYVIGPAGRVEWRERRFNPFLATSYDRLRAAVQKAGETGESR